jgi:hypothetical protein
VGANGFFSEGLIAFGDISTILPLHDIELYVDQTLKNNELKK